MFDISLWRFHDKFEFMTFLRGSNTTPSDQTQVTRRGSSSTSGGLNTTTPPPPTNRSLVCTKFVTAGRVADL